MALIHTETQYYACACPGCCGPVTNPNDATDAGTTDGAAVVPLEGLDPSSPDSGLVDTNAANGKPIWSAYQTAAHIARSSLSWADGNDLEVTYRFSDNDGSGGAFKTFTAANQDWARYTFDMYAEVSGLTFREVGANDSSANLSLTVETSGTNGGGYWDGRNVVVRDVSWEPETTPGTYALTLLMHEIGHGLGLSHPGPYNGGGFNYNAHADHWNDSDQFTNMSYWDKSVTGASFSNLSTLGLHDILAIQIEYGINWTTRADDTVYGYNQTTGMESYDLTYRSNQAFSIWDGDGNDTLDFSGSSTGTELDLRDGAFSSVNGQVSNVSIAYGAIIENGIGGAFDDVMRGNGVANVLEGGAGNDEIRGGEDVAPSQAVDPKHFTGIALNTDPNTKDQHLFASGVTTGGNAITVEFLAELTRMNSSGSTFFAYGRYYDFIVDVLGGDLRITINGSSFYTDLSGHTLVDGDQHRISVSWEASTGAVRVYLDGTEIDQSTLSQNQNLDTSGNLSVGQILAWDGQGVLEGYNREFDGTIGDIRIFDDVRTAQEIADNAFTTLNGNEQGLLHNWQVDINDTTTVSDVAGTADASIEGGATARNTAPVIDTTPDNDILIGGEGSDQLFGGFGDDTLFGDNRDGADPAAGNVDLVSLNAGFNSATTSGYSDHSLDQSAKFSFPATALTFEMLLRLDQTPTAFDTLFAYSQGGEWDTMDFAMRVDNYNSRWTIDVAGQQIRTGFNKSVFTSDVPVRLSLTWDSASGTLEIYLNGALSETHTLAAGASLPANGNFWVMSGWDDAYVGDVGDIRVWDSVRTAEDIRDTALIEIADPANTPGLLANWQVDPQDPSRLTDETGQASDLVVQNVSAGNQPSSSQYDFGDSFDDELTGGLGNDLLLGGLGSDDYFFASGDGDDIITEVASSTSTDRLVLDAGINPGNVALGRSGSDMLVIITLGNVVDTITVTNQFAGTGEGIEQIVFANGTILDETDFAAAGNIDTDQTLVGGNQADTLIGGSGNDSITGNGGDDKLTGNSGNDRIFGNAGNDVINANAGDDTINAGSGNDVVNGGSGHDFISGRGGDDDLRGGGGRDIFDYSDDSEGNDIIRDFTQGEDRIDVRLANISSVSEMAPDTSTAPGDTILSFGTTTITLKDFTGTLTNDDFVLLGQGTDADDRLYGNRSDNSLFGEAGNDYLLGKGGDDELEGGSGEDVLTGGRGNDDLNGGGGNDSLNGGQDNDRLVGGTGADTIVSLNGDDTLTGGNRNASTTSSDGHRDVFSIKAASARTVVITDFEQGTDVLNLRSFRIVDSATEIAQTIQGNDRLLTIDDTVIRLEDMAGFALTDDDFLL